METTRPIGIHFPTGGLTLVLSLILLLMVAIYLNSVNLISQQPPAVQSSKINFDGLILALENGDIPSEEEVLMWQQLLHRLKNQIDAGMPLTQAQIDQWQRIYDLTQAYVPWLEDFFELLKTIIQQITLENAKLEIDLSKQGDKDSDEDD